MKKKNLFLLFVLLSFCVFVSAQLSNEGDGKKTEAKKKYAHYIITEPAPPADNPATNLGNQPKDMLLQMTYLDDKVLKGAYYTECSWLLKAYPDKVWVTEHAHDFDEVFGFYGSDPNHPKDLGGEIELVIDGESHLITRSCLVFIPKGLKHCPLIIKKVNRPIFMFTSGPSAKYEDD